MPCVKGDNKHGAVSVLALLLNFRTLSGGINPRLPFHVDIIINIPFKKQDQPYLTGSLFSSGVLSFHCKVPRELTVTFGVSQTKFKYRS